MRSLMVFTSVTVDGYMAGPDSSYIDSGVSEPEMDAELTAILTAEADAMIIGRKSFAVMAAYWMSATDELAGWMNATPKTVLSTDPGFDVGAWTNTTLAAGDGVEQVRRLKATEGGTIAVYGGVETLRSLIAADLVDEYWLKCSPVVIGRGESMFAGLTGLRPLTLKGVKSYPSGTVALNYLK